MLFRIALRLVGCIQIVLGLAYLFVPQGFLAQMGHSVAPADLQYPLGMLAARFIAYGIGFWLISRSPERHVLWIRLMALIQAVDLLAGLVYSLVGVVPWSLSAFPMFNAFWIGLMCLLWRPAALPAIRPLAKAV